MYLDLSVCVLIIIIIIIIIITIITIITIFVSITKQIWLSTD